MVMKVFMNGSSSRLVYSDKARSQKTGRTASDWKAMAQLPVPVTDRFSTRENLYATSKSPGEQLPSGMIISTFG